jgi:DMSO/TMAO reductase YedYZ molybdopterin-dependent catalytic subunit
LKHELDKRAALRALARDIAPELKSIERRMLLHQSLSLGALTMLSGCGVTTPTAVESILARMSKFNDWFQGQLFSPLRLAPTFSLSDVTKPFPFNAYYAENEAPTIDGSSYRLQLSGMIAQRQPWSLEDLNALPQESQITRHCCVEGWSAIGHWSGIPLRTFLERVGADLTARYVGFHCADAYFTSIDMATALHPQTIIALKYADSTIPRAYGFPFKVRIPTKLGFKNPKYVTEIFVTNDYPGGYWENQGYNWFAGM